MARLFEVALSLVGIVVVSRGNPEWAVPGIIGVLLIESGRWWDWASDIREITSQHGGIKRR